MVPGQPPPPDWGGQPQSVPETNGKAIGALVASILGFVFCGIGFIIGLILGYSARTEIRASAGRQTGESLATAAIVIGWIGIGLAILAIVVLLFVMGFFVALAPR